MRTWNAHSCPVIASPRGSGSVGAAIPCPHTSQFTDAATAILERYGAFVPFLDTF